MESSLSGTLAGFVVYTLLDKAMFIYNLKIIKKYIDDIIIINTKTDCPNFFDYLKTLHSTIKFTK